MACGVIVLLARRAYINKNIKNPIVRMYVLSALLRCKSYIFTCK